MSTPQRKMTTLAVSGLLVMALALSACGNKRSRFDGQEAAGTPKAPMTTGHARDVVRPTPTDRSESPTTTVSAPYTIAGTPDLYAALAEEMAPVTDKFLAFSVRDLKVIPLDANGEFTRDVPKKLQLQVALKYMYQGAPQDLIFNASISPSGNTLVARNIRQENFADFDHPYLADLTCRDQGCGVIEIRLRRVAKSAEGQPADVLGQIGVLYRLSYARLEIQRPTDVTELNNAKLRELEELAAKTMAIKSSVVVVNGPSFTRVALPYVKDTNANDSSQDKPETDSFFIIETDLIDTAVASPTVNKVTFDAETKASAQLVGNDATSGSLIVDVTIEDENEKKESVQVIIHDETPATPVTTAPPTSPTTRPLPPPPPTRPVPREAPRAATSVDEGLFRTSESNMEGLRMAAVFAGYGEHPKVQHWVDHFIRKESRRILGLYTYAPAVSPFIKRVLETPELQLTPELAYILDLESNYLRDGNYDSTQVTRAQPTPRNPNPSAFGPWQIINDTAAHIRNLSGLPFNVIPVQNKQWHPQDDRGYLVQSTYMAGIYLKHLCERFKQDYALCVMAYHMGEGAAGKAITAVDEHLAHITKYQVTFAMVEQYRMASEAQIVYVLKFLALREIGQNPRKYGYDSVTPASTTKFRERLSRPQGPRPASFET